MRDYSEENAKRMAHQSGQILSGGGGVGGYAGPATEPNYSGNAQKMGLQGIGAGPGMVGGKPAEPDPMWLPLNDLIVRFRHYQQELRSLRIEVSSLKLRNAELEHSRTLSQG